MIPQEVFVSYASPDAAFAVRLVETLRRHGVPVWCSGTSLRAGQQWHDEIGAALERCDWFLVVLSPHALASSWVRREVVFALQQKRLEQTIVPILLALCDLGRFAWTLSLYQIADFTGSFEQGCREVLRAWGIAYRPL
ncbi:MAG: toll/interleukin-1 receptor domain-containing protein [Verrucomicrobia bacterium]|nr:toll/interleukin-1 receptor domain-containing protein [Verrucomicrobiota bacterium]